MFTGIIEKIGFVKKIKQRGESVIITIDAGELTEDAKIGDSIAVNGVCLTVTSISGSIFEAFVMHETMKRTSFALLGLKSPVNLERAMAADGRFGGHIVSGHIDGTGNISEIKKDNFAIWYTIQAKPEILRYVVEKGSIAIDGISLTVAQVFKDRFLVSVIPHSQENTTLSFRKRGDIVNLENDCVGKYIEKFLGKDKDSGITQTFLEQYGY